MASKTEAMGWSGLINYFGGENSRKTEFVDILPFPNESRNASKELMPRTARLLFRLLKEGKLPPRVEGVVRNLSDIQNMMK